MVIEDYELATRGQQITSTHWDRRNTRRHICCVSCIRTRVMKSWFHSLFLQSVCWLFALIQKPLVICFAIYIRCKCCTRTQDRDPSFHSLPSLFSSFITITIIIILIIPHALFSSLKSSPHYDYESLLQLPSPSHLNHGLRTCFPFDDSSSGSCIWIRINPQSECMYVCVCKCSVCWHMNRRQGKTC